MQRKSAALFFCALLCSTFAHDISNAKNINRYAKLASLKRAARSTTSGSSTTYSDSEVASLVSDNSPYYCTNSDGSVIGMTNSGKDKAVIIDVSAKLALIVDGSDGAAVIIDLEANVAKQILVGVWLSANVSIEAFVSTVDCQSLYNSATISVSISLPITVVADLVQSVLSSIDVTLAVQLQVDNTSGLSLAIGICADIQAKLASIDVSLIVVISTDLVECRGGLTSLQVIISSLVTLQVNVDVAAIVAVNVSLILADILTAGSGLSVVVNLCVSLSAAGLDLSAIISASVLGDVQALPNLCIGLGGNLCLDVDGILKVVVNILALISASIELDVLLTAIIKVVVNIDAAIDIITPLTTLQSCLSTQTSTYNSSSALSVIVDLVADLLGGTLVKADVDISAIVTLLCAGKGSSTVLELLVQVCGLLTLDVSLGVSVSLLLSTLLRVILELVDDLVGKVLLGIIIPDVLSIVVNLLNCVLSILSTLVAAVDSILNAQGLVAGLLSITITNIVYTNCADVIQVIINVSLSDCLTDSTAATEAANIKAILKSSAILQYGC